MGEPRRNPALSIVALVLGVIFTLGGLISGLPFWVAVWMGWVSTSLFIVAMRLDGY